MRISTAAGIVDIESLIGLSKQEQKEKERKNNAKRKTQGKQKQTQNSPDHS